MSFFRKKSTKKIACELIILSCLDGINEVGTTYCGFWIIRCGEWRTGVSLALKLGLTVRPIYEIGIT